MDSDGFTTVIPSKMAKSKSASSLNQKRPSSKQKQKQKEENRRPEGLLSTQTNLGRSDEDDDSDMERDGKDGEGVTGEGAVGGTEFEREPMFDGPSPMKVMDASATGNGGDMDEDDDALMIDPSSTISANPSSNSTLTQQNPSSNATQVLSFPPVSHNSKGVSLTQTRKLSIPPHRMTPLKRDWEKIYRPLVEELGLKVRVAPGRRSIEMKTSKFTPSHTSLQRAVDFVTAFFLGFAAEDALALLRMEELYIDSFEIKDVKQVLHADHLSRAIGRIAGKDGKTRFAIENATRTRIVLADSKIHILGTFQSIKIARDAVCALILGSAPGKVYANLRNVAARARERG